MNEKIYLGHSVFAEYDGNHLVLHTERNTISNAPPTRITLSRTQTEALWRFWITRKTAADRCQVLAKKNADYP